MSGKQDLLGGGHLCVQCCVLLVGLLGPGECSADGKPRRGRYTDNWARRDGTWVAVSAHYHLDQDG